MIGARQIGSEWLGSGRSQLLDYQELSATLTAVAGFATDRAGRGRAIDGNFAVAFAMDGNVIRQRGVSATMASAASLGGDVFRRRPLSASMSAGAGLTGWISRRTPVGSTTMAVGAGLAGNVGRRRSLGAAMASSVDMTGFLARQRGIGATMAVSAGLVPTIRSGIGLSATFDWSAGFGGRVVDFFQPAPEFRKIFVEPKVRQIEVPEKQRTIVFEGDDRGLSMEEVVKQPSETVDYDLDLRKWFRKIPTDYITNVVATVDIQGDPDDIELAPGSFPDWQPVGDPVHQAKLWITGGRDGIEYQVTAVVTTNIGRVEEVDFLIRVEEQ